MGNYKFEEFKEYINGRKAAVIGIQNDVDEINKNADSTGERAKVVNDLLHNIVAFCNNNPVMDESSVKMLTSILETTMTALSAFNQNVTETQGATKSISDAIAKLKGFFNIVSDNPDANNA